MKPFFCIYINQRVTSEYHKGFLGNYKNIWNIENKNSNIQINNQQSKSNMKPGSAGKQIVARWKDLYNYFTYLNSMSRFLLTLAKAEAQLSTR